ncbi:NAD-dependent succinate-semialdehyde dehydrogenase [Peribacillus frigoritolerans]|uniref:NAD-dependent succinate-semialdehyde dehydrogenase n=1 Tax=Peribacillus frigoritolerans TaxID=450367 RepID=UPI0032E458CB
MNNSIKTKAKKLFINGEWTEAFSGKTYDVLNPATKKVVATVFYGSTEEARLAIKSANDAFPKWAALTAKERGDYLTKLYELMLKEKESLAELITLEMGKPIKEARGEIELAAEYLLWNAEEGKRIYGESIPATSPSKRLQVLKQPIGPVGAITPWNFPVSMLTRKLGPALAAGCTFVVKPASKTPSSAIRLFELIEQVKFPKGVLNLVIGSSKHIGNEMMENPAIKKITFTGSTAVGKKLIEGSAQQVKKVSMELGGHAPFIVFEDANLEEAAEGVIISKYRNSGQTCICLNRLYVQKSVKSQFEVLLTEKVKSLKMGNGIEESTEVGPLVDEEALKKVEFQVEDALEKGAIILTGGKRKAVNELFFEPTLLSNATSDMEISYEETFGPVAPIYTFESEEEVIEAANKTDYGLAAYFYTNDLGRSIRVAEKLEYGIVGVNDATPTVVQAPFGGVKQSGLGREGGHQGVEEYLETKFISIKI